MTVYISPNPGKAMAYGIAQRAAQILLTHGAQVLMQDGLQAECMTMGVEYLTQKECLERTDVILTIGGDGTRRISHWYTESPSSASIWAGAAFWPPVRSMKWKPSSPP
mgnify:CR=1 FL=1